MSTLTYNGVSLQYVRTNQFVQEPVYDQSGTDYLYTRFYIEVECVWNAAMFPVGGELVHNDLAAVKDKQPVVAMSGVNYPNVGGNANFSVTGIRPFLLANRKQLKFTDDEGNVLLQSPVSPSGNGPPGPQSGFVDAQPSALTDDKLGPFPRFCNIVAIHGSTTFIVSFAVETFIVECPKGAKGPILSNRWRESMRIDRQMFQTRTHSGRLVLRGTSENFLSSRNAPTADQYRGYVFPPVPASFVRESIDINLSEDGLTLDYSIMDKSQYRVTNPNGVATEIEASYTERTGNGIITDADINVRIRGHQQSDPRDLISLACVIALSRVGVRRNETTGKLDPNGPLGLGGIPFSGSIRENLMYPEVSLTLTVKKTIRDASFARPNLGAAEIERGLTNQQIAAGLKFGISSSNLGITWLPGTAPSNFPGLSPGDFGPGVESFINQPNYTPGVLLVAQILSQPCRPVACTPETEYRISKQVRGDQFDPNLDTESTCTEHPGARIRVSPQNNPYGVPTGDGDGVLNIVTAITISILKTLPASDERSGFSEATLDFMYTDYSMDVVYDDDDGTLQLAVQDDVASDAIFISTSAPVARKIIRWVASRAGQWPKIPSKDTGNANEVFLRARRVPSAAELMPDASTYVYKIAGEYEYGLARPPEESDGLDVAAMPLYTATFAENKMPGSVYTDGIITPGATATERQGAVRPV